MRQSYELHPRDDMPLTLVVCPCYLFRHLAGRIRCRLPHPGLRDAHACQTVLRSAGKEQAREQCKRYDTSCSPHPSRLKKIHDIESCTGRKKMPAVLLSDKVPAAFAQIFVISQPYGTRTGFPFEVPAPAYLVGLPDT